MKKMHTLISPILAACLVLLLSTPVLGQERHHRGMMGQDSARMHSGMMDHQGMMGMMGMSPAMMMTRPDALLGLSGTLGLDDDQTARLEEIRTRAQESHRAHMEQAHTMHRQAQETLESDSPEVDAYTETLQSAMTHMARAHASMVRASLEARGVLTDQQKEQLRSAAAIMQSMHRMRGMSGMHGGDGMMHRMKKGEGGMPHGSR